MAEFEWHKRLGLDQTESIVEQIELPHDKIRYFQIGGETPRILAYTAQGTVETSPHTWPELQQLAQGGSGHLS